MYDTKQYGTKAIQKNVERQNAEIAAKKKAEQERLEAEQKRVEEARRACRPFHISRRIFRSSNVNSIIPQISDDFMSKDTLSCAVVEIMACDCIAMRPPLVVIN